jgi:hypothetical protein
MKRASAPGERVRVTAIVQSFNHEAYIRRALDSAVNQRGLESFEVLVGDDASTDGTRAVIQEYAHRYPILIRTLLPQRNMGGDGKVLFAELLRESRGEYIAMMDADDYWISDEKCRIQAEYLDTHPECALVFHNVIRQHDHDRRLDFRLNPPRQRGVVSRRQLYSHNPIAACSPMVRRSVVDPMPSWYFDSPWGDWALNFMAEKAGEIHYLPEVLGVYRIHDRGAYSGLDRLAQVRQDVIFFNVLPFEPMEPDRSIHADRLAEALAAQAYEHLRLGQWNEAREAWAESRVHAPTRWGRARGSRRARLRLMLPVLLLSPHFTWFFLQIRHARVASGLAHLLTGGRRGRPLFEANDPR